MEQTNNIGEINLRLLTPYFFNNINNILSGNLIKLNDSTLKEFYDFYDNNSDDTILRFLPTVPINFKDFADEFRFAISHSDPRLFVKAVDTKQKKIYLFNAHGVINVTAKYQIISIDSSEISEEFEYTRFRFSKNIPYGYQERKDDFKMKVKTVRRDNCFNLEQRLSNIQVFENSVIDAEKKSEKEFIVIDTNPHLQAEDIELLKAKAYLIGADALINVHPIKIIEDGVAGKTFSNTYQRFVGTPVKYK